MTGVSGLGQISTKKRHQATNAGLATHQSSTRPPMVSWTAASRRCRIMGISGIIVGRASDDDDDDHSGIADDDDDDDSSDDGGDDGDDGDDDAADDIGDHGHGAVAAKCC